MHLDYLGIILGIVFCACMFFVGRTVKDKSWNLGCAFLFIAWFVIMPLKRVERPLPDKQYVYLNEMLPDAPAVRLEYSTLANYQLVEVRTSNIFGCFQHSYAVVQKKEKP